VGTKGEKKFKPLERWEGKGKKEIPRILEEERTREKKTIIDILKARKLNQGKKKQKKRKGVYIHEREKRGVGGRKTEERKERFSKLGKGGPRW